MLSTTADHAHVLEISDGKRAAGRTKDVAVLPTLEKALAAIRGTGVG